MPYILKGRVLLVIALGMSLTAWGQGAAGRAAPRRPRNRRERLRARRPARRGAAARAPLEFYNYDTTAGSGPSIPDAPPTETHQKITVNGETLAYTARAGYLPLRNATTGQSEAHLFYTCYAKDGVSGRLGASGNVFPGRRARRVGRLAGVWRPGAEADEVGE